MKRLISTLIGVAFCVTVCAQTQWYKATSYAAKIVGYDWTSWIACDVTIKIDIDADLIVIYSNKTQIYKVIAYDGEAGDEHGGRYVQFRVIDQDADRGAVRLRVEYSGNSQLYVDFADISWVYNVIRSQ